MNENPLEKCLKNELNKLKLTSAQKEQLVGELDVLSNLIIDSYLVDQQKEM